MAEHRSLDSFGEADTTADELDDAGGTYRWVPDGASCSRCGDETRRLWRDGQWFVCPSCKEW